MEIEKNNFKKSASSVSKYIPGTIPFPCYHPLRQICQLHSSSQLTKLTKMLLKSCSGCWLASEAWPRSGQKTCDRAQTSHVHTALEHSLNSKQWFEYFDELMLECSALLSAFLPEKFSSLNYAI